MLVPFPPYRRNLRKKKAGRRREMLGKGRSMCSPVANVVAMGGDKPVPGHPSLQMLVMELAAEVPISKKKASPSEIQKVLDQMSFSLVSQFWLGQAVAEP